MSSDPNDVYASIQAQTGVDPAGREKDFSDVWYQCSRCKTVLVFDLGKTFGEIQQAINLHSCAPSALYEVKE